MSKTIFNILRGTHGMGVTIEIRKDTDRVILDFGAPFDPHNTIYDNTVRHRHKNKVKDAILLKQALSVDGLYNKEDIKGLPLVPYEESKFNTAVFISHLHLDHMSETDKIAKEIPVYIHEDGAKLNQILRENGLSPTEREFETFQYEVPVIVGKIKVTPYFSDHPCPGSSGFLVETDDLTVYYSGDVRYHGLQATRAWNSILKLSRKKVDLLIVDATMTSPSEQYNQLFYNQMPRPSRAVPIDAESEESIYEDTLKLLTNYQGLGIFNCYPRDVNMMESLNSLAEKAGRMAVWEKEYGDILYKMKGIKPHILSDNDDSDYPTVSVREIKEHPERYFLQNSYYHILNLIDFDGINGRYFHLFGEPLVSGTKEYQILQNMVKKLEWEFHTYSNLYSFSHAYPDQLIEMINEINPKAVIGVHSKHPELIPDHNYRMFFPEEGRDYTFDEIRL